MKSFEQLTARVPWWMILVAVCLILTVVSWFWLSNTDDPRMMGIVSGLFSGLVLYVFGLITQVTVFNKLEQYRAMGVEALLENRHDKAYYGPLLSGASDTVKVMGASATRFIDDFLDADADDHVLLDRLHANKRLQVQLLVPTHDFMSPDAKNRYDAKLGKIEQLKAEFQGRFAIRRFPHEARHSFVMVDGAFVGGPVFDGDKSRHAPAVHVVANKPFATKYRDYFNESWDKCADG
ncbi:hypothetical protein [Rhizobium bangladeshense]|uniref:hypothetical protein n=1 Tax=Rhizobium bangladeshense TaxID=1138189 RepID=UPI001A99F54A|nr:hypothetical protein [Rhizobium bangladeshense]MBX4894597.1 hypothetical protein [Rhizobium bangladeshense]MBX4914790.1 hypothetical protein [Rhizobium bangladeshense]MBY3612546.1 hypothetical protein [Rhizobium bangladeshense]QSY97363.1 hypothetical protein J2J97_24325 [Rhizobium bangladeshense]